MTSRFIFTPHLLRRIETDVFEQFRVRGWALGPGTRLFPRDRDNVPVRDQGYANTFSFSAIGIDETGARNIRPCVLRPELVFSRPYGVNPIARSYPDIHQLGTGLHEAAHIAHLHIDPRPGPQASDSTWRAWRVRAERTAELASAIYMLNRYPENPRIMEYLRLHVLSRRASAVVGSSDERTAAYDLAPALSRLLENPANWRLASGRGISLPEATAHALVFLARHDAALAATTPEEKAQARDDLCLHHGPAAAAPPAPRP